MSGRNLFLGIDLGGSKILAGVVTAEGKILSRAKAPTPFADGPDALRIALRDTSLEALKSAGTGTERIAGIGMGSPGPLDPERGVILRTPNIAVAHLAIGPWLTGELGAPVTLDNDVHMAVYGEARAGAARGRDSVVGIWIGTGVGGAILRNGSIVHGANRNAGELGHMILDARRAKAGRSNGTLEWEASKTGIARHIRKKVKRGAKSKLARHVRSGGKGKLAAERLHSSDLAKAFVAGDRPTVEAVERSARYVGIAVANLFDVLAPDLFVLGGGVATALGKAYLDLVRGVAAELAFSTELSPVRISLSRLGDDAGMLGAALAAADRLKREPGGSGGASRASRGRGSHPA